MTCIGNNDQSKVSCSAELSMKNLGASHLRFMFQLYLQNFNISLVTFIVISSFLCCVFACMFLFHKADVYVLYVEQTGFKSKQLLYTSNLKMVAPLAEQLRALFLNHSIISPLCLVWVPAPHWPHVRQAKFCLRVCQVFFLWVLLFSSHLLIGLSHMS